MRGGHGLSLASAAGREIARSLPSSPLGALGLATLTLIAGALGLVAVCSSTTNVVAVASDAGTPSASDPTEPAGRADEAAPDEAGMFCTADKECGSLSCIRHVCSTPCSTTLKCANGFCIDGGEGKSGCLLSCKQASDCKVDTACNPINGTSSHACAASCEKGAERAHDRGQGDPLRLRRVPRAGPRASRSSAPPRRPAPRPWPTSSPASTPSTAAIAARASRRC